MSPTRVRIVKNWDFPDLMAQSPGRRGEWDGVRFFEGEGEADHVVVLNQPAAPLEVFAPRNRIWAIIQEPPTPYHRHLHRGQEVFARIYTSDPRHAGTTSRHIGSQPALAWHAGLDFDTLAAIEAEIKKVLPQAAMTATITARSAYETKGLVKVLSRKTVMHSDDKLRWFYTTGATALAAAAIALQMGAAFGATPTKSPATPTMTPTTPANATPSPAVTPMPSIDGSPSQSRP